jgi:hypothetical protein
MKQQILLLQGVCELRTIPKHCLGPTTDPELQFLIDGTEDEDGDKINNTTIENGDVYLKPHIIYSMSNGDENVQYFEDEETMDNTVTSIIHSVQNKVIKLK